MKSSCQVKKGSFCYEVWPGSMEKHRTHDLEAWGSSLNPLPNSKIFDMTKLKAFEDDKFNVATMMIYLFDRIENTVGKGEKAVYQHFLLFSQCFK